MVKSFFVYSTYLTLNVEYKVLCCRHARHEIFYKKKKKKNSDKKKHTGIKKTLFLIEVILVLHTLVYHLLLILRAKYP